MTIILISINIMMISRIIVNIRIIILLFYYYYDYIVIKADRQPDTHRH